MTVNHKPFILAHSLDCEDGCILFQKEGPSFSCNSFTIAFTVLKSYKSDNASITSINVVIDTYISIAPKLIIQNISGVWNS